MVSGDSRTLGVADDLILLSVLHQEVLIIKIKSAARLGHAGPGLLGLEDAAGPGVEAGGGPGAGGVAGVRRGHISCSWVQVELRIPETNNTGSVHLVTEVLFSAPPGHPLHLQTPPHLLQPLQLISAQLLSLRTLLPLSLLALLSLLLRLLLLGPLLLHEPEHD